jgi:hypothetical protein
MLYKGFPVSLSGARATIRDIDDRGDSICVSEFANGSAALALMDLVVLTGVREASSFVWSALFVLSIEGAVM